MSTPLEPGATPPAHSTKPLWAAVGVLTAAVLAMGGTLLYTQTRPAAPTVSAVQTAATLPAPAVVTAPPAPAAKADDLVEKQAQAPVKSAPPATKHAAKPAHKHVAVAQASPQGGPGYVVQAPAQPARAVCTVCGTVESVTPVERKGNGTGLGAVGGGVLGAVLGNQVGGGNGRTAATILGAVGGGFAGNMVEKNMRKTTVYEITVRMEDGSVRHLERSTPVATGARVTLEGNTLRTADGAVVAPVPAQPAPPPAGAGPSYTGG